MRIPEPHNTWARTQAKRSPLNFIHRQEGTTAIEFGIVAIPFFMFIFGLMGVSTYFFMMTSLEKGMDQASRLIRTGQAQSNGMKVGDFKKKICQKANSKADQPDGSMPNDVSGWIKCEDLQVFVQSYAKWEDVGTKNCIENGGAAVSVANDNDTIDTQSGGANDIVLVTACYKWKFAGKLPYINLGQMNDGSMMMQSATAFRTEPYASN